MYTRQALSSFAVVVCTLLLMAPPAAATPAQQDFSECPWGYPTYDATTHSLVSQCSSGFVAAYSASRAAPVVDDPAAAVSAQPDSSSSCPWGYPAYDATTHTYFLQCSSGYVAP